MNEFAHERSPELMTASTTALVVIDVQEKLIGHIPGHARIVWNIRRLIDGAKILDVPVVATEQYPAGLGPTMKELAGRIGAIPDKLAFSCAGCGELMRQLAERDATSVLLAGIESHVCVMQSALDLLSAGYRVYVAADAVGARGEIDHQTALNRIVTHGGVIVTTEMALFEWCEKSGTAAFKQISALVKERPPEITNSQ
jgi:nicotinamidase-related amidase